MHAHSILGEHLKTRTKRQMLEPCPITKKLCITVTLLVGLEKRITICRRIEEACDVSFVTRDREHIGLRLLAWHRVFCELDDYIVVDGPKSALWA